MRKASKKVSHLTVLIAFCAGVAVLLWGGSMNVVHAVRSAHAYLFAEPLTTTSLSVYEWRDISMLGGRSYDDALRALHKQGYDHLYVSINGAINVPDTDVYAAQLDAFIARVNQDGLDVTAVSGDPSWAQPNNYAVMGKMLSFVKSYNDHAAHSITRLQFDIEPYALDRHATSDGVASALQGVVQYVTLGRQKLELHDVAIGYAVPFWLACSTTCRGNDVLQQMAAGSPDAFITVMAYRNFTAGSDGSLALAAPYFAHTMPRLHVLIGQEVTDTYPAKTTFYRRDGNDFRAALHTLDQHYKDAPNYGGLIVNNVPATLEELGL